MLTRPEILAANSPSSAAVVLLAATGPRKFGGTYHAVRQALSNWNDAKERDLADVLGAFDQAIDVVDAELAVGDLQAVLDWCWPEGFDAGVKNRIAHLEREERAEAEELEREEREEQEERAEVERIRRLGPFRGAA